jgi:hypothetical protein
MRYYIRDDDTSFFTTKKDLDEAYSDIWKYGPVNLAIIPFTVKTENHGKVGLYNQIPEKEYFIGDNYELVEYIKILILENKVNLMLHGYNHYYMPCDNKLYPFGIPEFIYTKNQQQKIEKGKKALEELFGIEIKWFIPPSNALKNETIIACDKLGLNIPLVFDLKKRRIKDLFICPLNLLINRLNKYNNINYPLRFYNHKEIACVSYTSVTDFTYLQKKKYMVIATHYWELNKYKHIKDEIMSDIKIYGDKIYSMNEI